MGARTAPARARTSPLRRFTIRCVSAWEQCYQRRHQLEAVGPLFLLGISPHAGPSKQFDDGSVLQPGDPLGILHFNNACIARLGISAGRHHAAWEFTRMLRSSLCALAEFASAAPGHRPSVYRGTTWMQAHGLKVGFVIEPLAPGWRTMWLRCHFRLLQMCFSPAALRDRKTDFAPRLFWITRPSLHRHFLRAS